MRFFYSLIFILFTTISAAQTYQVKGSLTDENTHDPLIGANIFLFALPDSTNSDFAVSDSKGSFSFRRLKPGAYYISVSYIGYEPFKRAITVVNSDLELGSISVKEKTELLNEVTIAGKVPPVTQKGDTLQFNADAYKTNPDANAENLLEKMPGIMMQNGKVQAQGEDVRRVLVDGREFFGNDPNAALRNLPADIIEKIEIFDQQSEQSQFTGFDDGNTIKTINIVTRPEARNGLFGKAYAGYGTEDRYSAGANINDFNEDRRISILGLSNNINEQNFSSEDLAGVMSSSGGRRGGGKRGKGSRGRDGRSRGMRGAGGNAGDFLVAQQDGITRTNSFGVNYSDQWGEKVAITGSYFFNRTANTVGKNLFREYILPADSGTFYREFENALGTNVNHRANLRINYEIDENNSILYRPSVSVQLNDGKSLLSGETFDGSKQLNGLDNNFSSDLSALRLSNNLLYRHRFEKVGRTLSLNISQQYNTTGGNSSLTTQNFEASDAMDSLDQIANMDQYRHSLSANIIFTERLGKALLLTLNHRTSWSQNDSDQNTYKWDALTQAYGPADSLLSNNFQSGFTTNASGAGLLYRNGNLTLNGRVSFQHARLTSDQQFPYNFSLTRTFKNILPMFNLRYKVRGGKSFRLTYRTNTNEPSVNQLQEVLDNDNPLNLSIGNSTLEQEYDHSMFLRYSAPNTDKGTIFFAFLSGSVTDNYIGRQVYFANRERMIDGHITLPAGAQLRKPVNLHGYYNLRSFITYGMPVNFIRSNLNLNISGSYGRTPGMVNNKLNYSYSPSAGGGITLSSNISEEIDFTFSGHTTYNFVSNSVQKQADDAYFSNRLKGRMYWDIWKGIVFTSNLTYQWYTGLSANYNQNYLLWNLSIGKRVLKERGELRLSAYDVLKENTNISRHVTAAYIQDTQTDILQQYFMLSFRYNIRDFGDG